MLTSPRMIRPFTGNQSARLRSTVADRGLRLPLSPLAAKFPYPFFCRLWQDWPTVRACHPAFCRRPQHSPPEIREGPRQRKKCLPLLTGCGEARSRSSCPHWIGTREDLHLEILATQRSGKSRPPPHGLGATDGRHRSFLLLLVGSTMGWDLLQDQRLCSFSHLALAQRP